MSQGLKLASRAGVDGGKDSLVTVNTLRSGRSLKYKHAGARGNFQSTNKLTSVHDEEFWCGQVGCGPLAGIKHRVRIHTQRTCRWSSLKRIELSERARICSAAEGIVVVSENQARWDVGRVEEMEE